MRSLDIFGGRMTDKTVLIVGSGLAGLTAGAFLVKENIPVTILEKESHIGGLVTSFEREGYIFDGGLRAVESSGLIISSLQDLGIDLKLIKSTVTLGIGDDMIPFVETDDVDKFETLLKRIYPEESDAIDVIMTDIRNVMTYMVVLLGGEAPVYKSGEEKEKVSFWKTYLPWLIKLLKTIPKLSKLKLPIEDHLKKITQNQAMIDIIIQHFFEGTPASFALAYFLFYFDYNYPAGGTGALSQALADYITAGTGDILTETKICSVDPERRTVRDQQGKMYSYEKMIWTADNKYLYSIVDADKIDNKKLRKKVAEKQAFLQDLRGAESVYTVYAGVDLPPSFFKSICTEHVFYTPDTRGLHTAKPKEMKTWLQNKQATGNESYRQHIKEYLKDFFYYNTFEISFPVLRDASLAPKGKTGMIVSCLFDYDLCKFIQDSGWYDEFKTYSESLIIEILDKSIFPGLTEKTELCFSATPLSLERYTGNTDGAIVGWSFMNPRIPVPQSMVSMPKAVTTVMPHIYQAGQWTYSPAGLPISLLTGKVAAGRVKKKVSGKQ